MGVPCAFHMFSKGRHGLSLADEDWAEGRKQDPYTTEQIGCIIEKVKAGELTLPAGMQEKFSGGGDFPANIPDPEVAVWPILADAFFAKSYVRNRRTASACESVQLSAHRRCCNFRQKGI